MLVMPGRFNFSRRRPSATASQWQSVMQSAMQFTAAVHNAVIRVYDGAGNLIETHEHTGEFNEPQRCVKQKAATR
jgi:hypothetical protein